MKRHELKTHTEYFNQVWQGNKGFELRRNDRGFEKGDRLILQDYDPEEKVYRRRIIMASVDYIIHGPAFGLMGGFVAMSITIMEKSNH